jgi:hypothetical protein
MVFEALCQAVHAKLLAGRCPWCGSAIINGKELDPPLPLLSTGRSIQEMDETIAEEMVRRHPGHEFLETLKQCGVDVKKAVPLMVAALTNVDWRIRRAAAIVLGGIGPDAKESLPILAALLEDGDYLVREAAAAAIKRIGK